MDLSKLSLFTEDDSNIVDCLKENSMVAGVKRSKLNLHKNIEEDKDDKDEEEIGRRGRKRNFSCRPSCDSVLERTKADGHPV